jgi:ribosomal protein S18 acetylase RimI-like enzyme
MPIGFVSASLHTTTFDLAHELHKDPQVQILTLGVDPQYRRRGIGRHLVMTAVHDLQDTARNSPGLSRIPLLSDGTLVKAQVAGSSDGGKEFYEAIGMESSDAVLNDFYRPSHHRDAFVLVGRVH